MSRVLVCVMLALLQLVAAHQQFFHKDLRTGQQSLLNGIASATRIETDGNYKQEIKTNPFVGRIDKKFANGYACGGLPDPLMEKYIYNGAKISSLDKNSYDFTKPPVTGNITGFAANTEQTLTIKGFFHQGVVRVAICYNLTECNNARGYEDYILGYWYMLGVMTTSTQDIYSLEFKIKVKIPNRNCDRCVLQVLFDSSDNRAYVNCLDVKISGATSNNDMSVTCNGHPLCNCTDTIDNSTGFGLGKACPKNIPDAYSFDNTAISQLGVTEFCKNCIQDACVPVCNQVRTDLKGFYNGDASTQYPLKPQEKFTPVVCSPNRPCYCPGCQGGFAQNYKAPGEAISFSDTTNNNNNPTPGATNTVTGASAGLYASSILVALFAFLAVFLNH
eukprot:Colp12_sorted_trinity150504_noHs@26625